jgi:translation initiation factor 3 subunit A
MQNIFQNQVVSRREGEFERLKREREERLAEVRAIRKQERMMRRKMEYYRRQEEGRLMKLKEEEEARKREGKIEVQAISCITYVFICFCQGS